jgi:hypothetical protein
MVQWEENTKTKHVPARVLAFVKVTENNINFFKQFGDPEPGESWMFVNSLLEELPTFYDPEEKLPNQF